MSRAWTIAPLVAAVAGLALAAPAAADYHTVIRDCNEDSKLDRHYSHDDLKKARDHLPTDIREYTNCLAVIEAALVNGGHGTSSGGGGGTGAGGATTKSGAIGGSPADVSALGRETSRLRTRKPSITVGGQTIVPAASGLDHVPGAANRLPLSLLLAILAVAALCAAGGIAAARRPFAALVRAPLGLIRR